jgi:hypothetical protein
MRRARARRLAAVAAVSASQAARWRSRPPAVTRPRVVKPQAGCGADQERRPPGRGAAAGRRCRPGPRSGGWSAAPGAPRQTPRPGAGRAGHGPGPRGPPGWHPGVGRGPWRRVARLGRSSSTTCSAWAARNRVRPAPSPPVPAIAPTRWPGCWAATANSWRSPAGVAASCCLGDHHPGGGGHDRGGGGVDPDGRARLCLPAWPCVDSLPGHRRDGIGPGQSHGRTVTGHARLASGGQAPTSGQLTPVWADAASSERTRPGHDTTRVSHSKSHATATDDGPDHHRTKGSLTVIPPATTRPHKSALAGRPTRPDLRGRHPARRHGRWWVDF